VGVISKANDRCLRRCLPPGGTLICQNKKEVMDLLYQFLARVCQKGQDNGFSGVADVGPNLWRIEPKRWGVKMEGKAREEGTERSPGKGQ